jgi:hypothetical protein
MQSYFLNGTLTNGGVGSSTAKVVRCSKYNFVLIGVLYSLLCVESKCNFITLGRFLFLLRSSPNRVQATCLLRFLDLSYTNTHTHTHTHTQTVGLLNEWSALREGSCLQNTTHNKHKKRTSVLSAGFEPTIPAVKRLQTYALDLTVT